MRKGKGPAGDYGVLLWAKVSESIEALQHIADITGGRAFHALGKEEDLVEVYQTLDKITPDKVKREIYRPQRDFFWIPLAVALLVFTLYHCLALLIALLRSPRREPTPERATIAEVSHGN